MVNWMDDFSGAITVCDRDGIVVYMNKVSRLQFQKYGGGELLGKNLLDCHPEPSKTRLKEMLAAPMQNAYTTEKNGRKKQIVQTPWMEGGEFKGVVEISFELPADMPSHVRS
ncbi:MAG: PAS domain-containing protein [Mangrovibacterium sp.]